MLKPKTLIRLLEVNNYKDFPISALVYANVYLEQRLPAGPLEDFSIGIREVDVYRVSYYGYDIINMLPQSSIDDLENQMGEIARKNLLEYA